MESYLPIDLERPTRALISLNKLEHNFQVAKEHLASKNTKIMAMVKANAYGHGILKMAQQLVAHGSEYLGVAFLEEGIYLRQHGITTPILVMGAINTNQIENFLTYDLELTIPSIEKARKVSEIAVKYNKHAVIHLKIDTGMERIGVHWYNCEKFFEEIFSLPGLIIKGIYSHFAMAGTDSDFTHLQIKRFEETIELVDKKWKRPELVHIANSAAIVSHPESHFNLVRPGLMLYGYGPSQKAPLQPVMALLSKVAYFKVVPKETSISYNHTFTFKEDSRVATIPVGYGDGYNRLLSNRGEVIIRNKKYPIVGNICMDQLMVNLGPNGEAYNGDDVLLFGQWQGNSIPIESICQHLGTIPYEVTCSINTRVPRIYI